MPPEPLFDLGKLDSKQVVADRAAIEAVNPQRFEMMQLTAIDYVDTASHTIIGHKDVTPNEFWVRGHMPDFPLMPGVIMCEVAAQLMSYYVQKYKVVESDLVLFGGMNDIKFRGQVRVGDRLTVVCRATKIHRRQVVSAVQGFVGHKMVFEGEIVGVPFTPSAPSGAVEAQA